MALTPIPVSAFPNVPALPGVPSLARIIGANVPLPVLSVADSLGLSIGQSAWGIFDQFGSLLINASSFVDMDFSADSDVPTYPLEGGAFQNYNKVNLPYVVKVTLALSGSFTIIGAANALASGTLLGALNGLSGNTSRTNFLASLDATQNSTALVNVVTPEITYANTTITHREFSRSADQGATLLTVSLWFSQINLAATSTVINAASTNGASSQGAGTVQTIPVTSSQLPPIAATGAN